MQPLLHYVHIIIWLNVITAGKQALGCLQSVLLCMQLLTIANMHIILCNKSGFTSINVDFLLSVRRVSARYQIFFRLLADISPATSNLSVRTKKGHRHGTDLAIFVAKPWLIPFLIQWSLFEYGIKCREGTEFEKEDKPRHLHDMTHSCESCLAAVLYCLYCGPICLFAVSYGGRFWLTAVLYRAGRS